jgi:phage shock protein C
MDKIITINLGGYAIKMEEDAYEALKPYIRQIEETFANTENGKEIINDIEARLAEMLMERTEGKVSATIEDVEFVKKAMGNPGEFKESQSEESPKQSSTPNDTVKKRLYRDTDNKVFGGVCSGISNYFDIDPTIIRLIWVGLLFFFGSGFLLYFILWVIVPEAVTTAQKLEMKGEAPTLDNIINRVKTEAGKVEQNLKAQNFGQRIGDIFGSLSPVFLTLFKGFAIFIGLFVLIILSGVLVALFTGGAGFISHYNNFSVINIPNFFNAGWEFLTFKILVGLFICIPLFNILTGLLKFAFNTQVNYKPIRQVLSWIWVATIPLLIYFVYTGVKNFKSYETVSTEKTENIASPLLIKSTFNEENYMFNGIDVRISFSNDSLVHITTTQSANGRNASQAREMAERNGAGYTISGNELILKTGDYFQKSGLFRRQKVEFLIEIPNGKSFSLDKSFQKTPGLGVTAEGSNVSYYYNDEDDANKALLFLNGALYCPSCPDSIPPRSSGLHNYSNFSQIEVEGMVDVEIRPGTTYSIQKSGPANVIKHMDIWQSGNVLSIDMDEDYFNLKTHPKVIITMPELIRLKLSGVADCKTGHFGGEELFVELNGASMAILDAEYSRIDLNMAGVCRVDLSGKSKSLNCEISGSSHLNAEKLTMEAARVNLSGVSEATLGLSKTITGGISGASKLFYTGNPTLQVTNNGVSEVKQIEK